MKPIKFKRIEVRKPRYNPHPEKSKTNNSDWRVGMFVIFEDYQGNEMDWMPRWDEVEKINEGGKEMDKLTVKFPTVLNVTAAGLFALALITATSQAEADVFFLQGQDGAEGAKGEKGDKGDKGDTGPAGEFTGTFTGDVTFEGNLTVNGMSTVDGLAVDDLTVNASYDLPDCPEGYLKDDSQSDIVLCKKGADLFCSHPEQLERSIEQGPPFPARAFLRKSRMKHFVDERRREHGCIVEPVLL